MKRSNSDETLDLLSELPESLILHILSSLGMRDVVKTTLLSKFWKDLWTTIPCLDFNDYGKHSPLQTRNFINRVLQRWKGTKILTLKIAFTAEFDESMYGDMDSWVRFATEKNVQELCIYLPYDYSIFEEDNPVYLPPQCLYSCSSIKKLCIIGNDYNLQISGNLKWDRLKHLMIHGYRISEDVINQVVSSAPQLEILDFRLIGSDDQSLINIHSTSLKKLKVRKNTHSTSLTIWAPNLETLVMAGAAYSSTTCSLLNVSSLTDVNLDFFDECDVAVGETLKHILPIIHRVISLTLSSCCFKVLGVIVKGKYSFSKPFMNVKILKLSGGCVEPYDIGVLVEIFPRVEELFINWRVSPRFTEFLAILSEKHDLGEKYLEGEAKKLKPFLMQLRTVEVTWYTYEAASIFEVIKFLLTNANVLQRIVQKIEIQSGGNRAARLQGLILAAQELLSLRRSFPTVDLIFCEK